MLYSAKRVFFAFLFCCVGINTWAQPDSNYFQQQVNYTIKVKLDDVNHTLTGFETIEYKNNSPHTLKYIYFHLWPNAYKNNQTALAKQLLDAGEIDFYYAPESEKGFIDSLLFVVGADTLKWEYFKEKKNEEDKSPTEYIDIAKVTLKKPLQPDSTVVISTPFFVKLPSGLFSRLGHIGQSYQITQWYPKPAVYDKNGWNQMPYLNQGEFYSEYGDFDVSITLPSNYLLAATGELTGCPQEQKWLEQKAKETQALFDEYKVNKVGNLTGGDEFPVSSNEWKTLRYVQKNVHDFAWFADKRWHVLKGEYVFDKSGKVVDLWAFFTKKNSRFWKKSIQYLHDAVKYYSQWNGNYPYSIVQAVDGTISAGGGMEYPTITNIGDVSNDVMLETVIVHEVGHNWFYGILGSNERAHPWLDEGLNSANEMRYLTTKYPELNASTMLGFDFAAKFLGIDTLRHRMSYYLGYKWSALTNNDQPIEGPAAEFTDSNYGTIVYYKSAACLNYLRAYLGDELYDKCMHAYYDAWKFKHPQPNDFRKIMEKVSKKNLSWFFDDLVNSNKVLDYKLTKKKKPNTKSSVTYGWMKYEEGVEVKNTGGIAAPFCVVGYKNDTIADMRWYQGFTGKYVVSFPNGNYDRIQIDPFYDAPEISHKNNSYKYKIKGRKLFARTEKLKFKFLMGYDNPERSTLFYTPVLAANAYDGLQLGAAFYNSFLFQKRVEYTIMPLFGFQSKQPNGSISFAVNSNHRKSSFIRNSTIGFNAVKYSGYSGIYFYPASGTDYRFTHWFFRVDPYLNINFKPKRQRSPISNSLLVKYIYTGLNRDVTCNGNCDGNAPKDTLMTNSFINASFIHANKKTLMPYGFMVNLRQGPDFMFTMADFTISRILGARGKKITARAYAGAFIYNTSNNPVYNLRGDGIRGSYDYLFQSTFIGRYEFNGVWAQQFTEGFANLKVPTAYAQSNKWNAAVNITSDLPIPVFKIFADVAVAPFTSVSNGQLTETVKAVADAGVYLPMFNGILNIYVPLYISKAIADEFDANNRKFHERIRFTFDINKLAPQRLTKSFNVF